MYVLTESRCGNLVQMLVYDVLIVKRFLTKVSARTIAPLIYLEAIFVAAQEVLLPFFKSVWSRNLVIRI